MTERRHPHLRLLALAVALVIGATLGYSWLAYAGSQAGHWGARELQVQNLGLKTAFVTMTLYHPDGWIVTQTNFTVPPLGSTYFRPAFPNWVTTGTLVIDSDGLVDGAVAHLEEPALEIGNEVYEMRDEAVFTTEARLPLLERDLQPGGSSTIVILHGRGRPVPGDLPITATLTLRGPNNFVISSTLSFEPNATRQFDLALENRLPQQWRGFGTLQATGPVLVQVARQNGVTYDAYLSLADTGTELVFPWVKGSAPGSIQSTIELANPNALTASLFVRLDALAPFTMTLAPRATGTITLPAAAGLPYQARIVSLNGVTVSAITRMISQAPGVEGSLSYPALDVSELRNHASAPLVYDSYLGWKHLTPYGVVALYNAGPVTATANVIYRPAGAGTQPVYQVVTIAPHSSLSVPPPAGISPHWALAVNSTQPVGIVVVGYRSATTGDHWFAYRSEPYNPPAAPPRQTVFIPFVTYNVTPSLPPASSRGR